VYFQFFVNRNRLRIKKKPIISVLFDTFDNYKK